MKGLVIIVGVLTGILSGEYKAKTLSVAEQDSILNDRMSASLNDGMVCTRYRLEKENEQKIFRHSEVADWYVLDTMRRTRKQLGAGMGFEQVRDVEMSPNGRYVAFAKDNNLYVHKLDFGTEIAVTKDEDPDIINGVADWLYEEEFGTTALYAWSEDSKQLAFVRLDERDVPTFAWQEFLGAQYPVEKNLRYPKAGCENAQASVWVYDMSTKALQKMKGVTDEGMNGVYIPRLKWENGNLMVLRVNRDQTKMEVLRCNAKSTLSQVIYTEESKDCFMDYSLFDEWQWLSDGRFIVLSEKDGWRSAYLYNNQGFEQKRLTPDGIDVTAVYAVDEKTQTLYYQAAPTPSTRQIYALNIKKGTITQLTTEEGMWAARFAKDGKKAVFCYQSFETPNRYCLWKVEGGKWKEEKVIEDNAAVREAWKANKLPEPELMRINGLEAMLLSAQNTDRSADRAQMPLVVMHYSGPASQRVLNRWRKNFEYALVEQGYAVLIVDTRGSDNRGRAWRNETYMHMGQKEAEDLIAAAEYMAKRPDIDGDRMAILGWSYGGYETLYTMSTKNHPFKAGVAIAPVTDWRLYDTGYTERYMRRPQVNNNGYEAASLLNKAADLTGNVLIIHGTGDDNVHVQHTMQYIDALVKENKQFEMQLYPDDNHHLRKGNNAKHMHERVLLFLEKELR